MSDSIPEEQRKTVLITGSGRGLGKALAQVFAFKEWNVVLHDRDVEPLEETRTVVLRAGIDCAAVTGDLTEMKVIEKLIDVAKKKDVEVFINNAGVYLKWDITGVGDAEIRALIETNLIAPILLTKRILKLFHVKGKGTLININSTAGKAPSAGESVYCASKHGLRGFTSSLQFETKGDVRIIDVYLGAMQTRITKDRDDYEKLIHPQAAAHAIYGLLELGDWGSLKIKEINIGRKNY